MLDEKRRLEAEVAAEQQVLQRRQQKQHADDGTQQQQQPEEAADADAADAGAAGADGKGVDSLDAFMSDVAQNLEVDKVGHIVRANTTHSSQGCQHLFSVCAVCHMGCANFMPCSPDIHLYLLTAGTCLCNIDLQLTALQKELESIEQLIQRTDRLIHIADPDGWYNPHKAGGSSGGAAAAKAAAEAKAAAKAALEADKQRRAEAVAKQRAGWAAAQVGCYVIVCAVLRLTAFVTCLSALIGIEGSWPCNALAPGCNGVRLHVLLQHLIFIQQQ